MTVLLLHVTFGVHFHPEQLAVAFLLATAVVAGSWVMRRRRS